MLVEKRSSNAVFCPQMPRANVPSQYAATCKSAPARPAQNAPEHAANDFPTHRGPDRPHRGARRCLGQTFMPTTAWAGAAEQHVAHKQFQRLYAQVLIFSMHCKYFLMALPNSLFYEPSP